MSSSRRDSWLKDYESLVELGARLGMKIRERDQHTAPSQTHKLNASIDKMLREYQRKLQNLKGELYRLSTTHTISEHEYEKRKSMIEELSSKSQQLERARRKGWPSKNEARYNGTGSDPWGTVGDPWGGGDTHGPGTAHRMSADEIRAQQQEMIKEQDDGLDALSQALRRQQQLGYAMADEVDEHTVIIDDIHEAATRADQRIKTQTRRVEEFRRKDSGRCTCVLWMIIILLGIAILVIALVPINGKP